MTKVKIYFTDGSVMDDTVEVSRDDAVEAIVTMNIGATMVALKGGVYMLPHVKAIRFIEDSTP